jgi:hypothetical protein
MTDVREAVRRTDEYVASLPTKSKIAVLRAQGGEQ